MRSLLIVGAGGYGLLVKEIATLLRYKKIDFLDDNSPLAVGKISELDEIQKNYDGSIVAIGNAKIRENVFLKLVNPVTLIHPDAIISPSANVEKGCVIEAGTVVSTGATVKMGAFICAGAVVNHNAVVESFCQVDCNAVVASGVTVITGTKVESCNLYNGI